MSNLFRNVDTTIIKEEAMDKVENHAGIVFLARLPLRAGLNVFHHFIKAGETVYSNEEEVGFILGLQK